MNLKEKRNGFQGGYGKLVTRGREYSYDEEGNLSEKKEANGSTWRYLYYGNGKLKEVIRPDQSSVCFQYDTFGRRVEKSIVGKRKEKAAEKKRETVTRFLWDGNTLFHEWEEEKTADTGKSKPKVDYKADFLLKLEKREAEKARKQEEQGKGLPDNLITWVFQDDFIPRGKITKDGSYSIITDYLGTPVEMYDGEGRKVWERELDIYGRVKLGTKDTCGKDENGTGEQNFIPFRFQGQYEDEETGLYYNRFRYYSPEDGCYTQQDPIGLAGGMNLYSYVRDSNFQIDVFGWEDIVFRCLSQADITNINNGLGLIPKNPSASATALEHVLYGSSDGYGDQFISFTRSEKFAKNWAKKNGTAVVSVDLDTIHNTTIDLSTPEGRIANLGDASKAVPDTPVHKANKFAKGAKEVLVEGEVPNSKIKKGGSTGKVPCCG